AHHRVAARWQALRGIVVAIFDSTAGASARRLPIAPSDRVLARQPCRCPVLTGLTLHGIVVAIFDSAAVASAKRRPIAPSGRVPARQPCRCPARTVPTTLS